MSDEQLLILLNHNSIECKEGRQFDTGVPRLLEGGIIERLVVFGADVPDCKQTE